MAGPSTSNCGSSPEKLLSFKLSAAEGPGLDFACEHFGAQALTNAQGDAQKSKSAIKIGGSKLLLFRTMPRPDIQGALQTERASAP